ncbi:calaxin-like isoform X2 [Arvicanthis niloticus]|uniref:calaxin-like isoform X2 n=1 Tax=Arvicanthis niloticus TaxID=61156 RepID=UPI00402B289C
MEQRAMKKLAESIRKTVKSFNKFEIECLIQLFYSLAGSSVGKVDNARLDRNTFRGVLQNIFGMTHDMLMNRVFFVFDKDGDNHVNLQEWIKGLAVFLRGTFEEKMRFCFEVYYLSGDAYISREKIFDMLKSSLFQHSPEDENEEGVKDLVEISLKKMMRRSEAQELWCRIHLAIKPYGSGSLLQEWWRPLL